MNPNTENFESKIFKGTVSHTRMRETKHTFTYNIELPYFDLTEVDKLFNSSFLWSKNRFNIASFHEKDFFDNLNGSLFNHVKCIAQPYLSGKEIKHIRVLGNCRFLGLFFNPICVYYCFDETNKCLGCIAQVTNTPWLEKHCYFIPAQSNSHYDSKSLRQQHIFEKRFHVSPFMPMNQIYHWNSLFTDEKLSIHMKNFEEGKEVFNVSLKLKPTSIKEYSFTRFALAKPLNVCKTISAIYYQALKLWLKKSTFYNHNRKEKLVKNKENYYE